MMHWGSRRKRNSHNDKDFSHDALARHVRKLMFNRWQLLTPPPLDPNAMWDALLTDEQHAAFKLLQDTMPTSLSCGTQLFLKWDLPLRVKLPLADAEYVPDMVEITLPEPRPIPATSPHYGGGYKLFVSQLPRDMLATLAEWVPKWLWVQGETYQVLSKVDDLFAVCNTMGHIKRVWPNVATMLPERAQLKLAQAKARSPYPSDVLEPDDDTQHWKLAPEWRPEVLEWYDEWLTEAMCLPLEFDEPAGLNWSIEVEKKRA